MKNLCFLDIETTGVDPARDLILEIGVVNVDSNLVETSRASIVFGHPSELVYGLMDDYVREMHTENGLLAEVRAAWLDQGLSYARGPSMLEWLIRNVPNRAILAGYSVHFDREFIVAALPNMRGALHHRCYDVSTIRESVKAWGPGTVPNQGNPPAHRTIADCLSALAEAVYYRSAVFGVGAAHPEPPSDDALRAWQRGGSMP